jgi:DASS family divalent anion:Na+ symporter
MRGGLVFPVLRSINHSAFGPSDSAAARCSAAFLTIATSQSTCVTCAMFMTAMAGNPAARG